MRAWELADACQIVAARLSCALIKRGKLSIVDRQQLASNTDALLARVRTAGEI